MALPHPQFLIQEVWGRVQDFVFLTRAQVMPILLVLAPDYRTRALWQRFLALEVHESHLGNF